MTDASTGTRDLSTGRGEARRGMPLRKMAESERRLDVKLHDVEWRGVRRGNGKGKGEIKRRLHSHVEQPSSHKGNGDRRNNAMHGW